jgi:hypothetical protein
MGDNNNQSKSQTILEELQKIAESHGGKCLSKDYINMRTKLKWQCKMNHVWKATPYPIKKGTWCPTCSRIKYSIEDMQKIAAERGGKCLSEKYENSEENLTWQCAEGHTWEARPKNIKKGTWCPKCNATRK